jgi:O-antigen ligase
VPHLAQPERAFGVFLALFVGALCLTIALALASTENLIGLAITLGILVAVVCFLWPEIGLYILLLSMLLSPEIIVGSLGGVSTTAGRGVTLRLDDFLLLLIAVTWIARGAVYKELGLFLKNPLNRPIAAYLAIAGFSTMLGILFDRVRPLMGLMFVLKYAEYIIVYFAVVNFIRDKKHLKRMIWVALLTAFLVSLYATAQIPQGIRVSAPFEGETGEPNTLGGYLLFMIAIFGGLLVTSPSLRKGYRYALGIAVLGVPFLFTLSRASYLGALFVAPVLIALSRRKLIAGFSVIIFFLVLLFFAPPSVVERIQYTIGGQRQQAGQMTVGDIRLDTSTSARVQSYSDVLQDFPQHPILGYGVTGYGFLDGQYPRVLIEMGLLGMAAFLWLLYSLIRLGWNAYRSAEEEWERGICLGFLAGVVGLSMHAMGGNTFIIVRIMEPFWFFAGAVTLLHLFNTGDLEEGREELEELKEIPAEERAPIAYGLIHPLSGQERR